MVLDRAYLHAPANPTEWPFTLPVVNHLLRGGLTFSLSVTFLVGENGSGKSTLVEAIAEAYGLDVRGGHGGRRYASNLQKSELGKNLRLSLGSSPTARRGAGFFLRSETAHSVFSFMSDHGVPGYGREHLDRISHGEGYLQVLRGNYFSQPGLFILDEPEAALSFSACLALLSVMAESRLRGAQFICATHSPLLTALPGSQILLLNDGGIHETEWSDLEFVKDWQKFMTAPNSFIEHFLTNRA